MSKLNYHPNRVARRLRAPGQQMWALVVPDIENPFFTSVARAVEDSARQHGSMVFMGNSDGDKQREANYLEIALTERVGGVVLAPSTPTTDISMLLKAQIPVVVIDVALTGVTVDTVLSDHYVGGQLAAQELLNYGYRKIAAVVSRTIEPSWNQKLRGLSETLEVNGGSVVNLQHHNNRIDGGYQAMQQLLDQRIDFDAIFVSNNLMTIGILRALQNHGLSVPQDFGLIGFDLGSTPMTYPVAITSINQNPRKMGFLAGCHIANSNDRQRNLTTYLPMNLVSGGSLIQQA